MSWDYELGILSSAEHWAGNRCRARLCLYASVTKYMNEDANTCVHSCMDELMHERVSIVDEWFNVYMTEYFNR